MVQCPRRGLLVLVGCVAVVVAGCASSADVGAMYSRGIKAAKAERWASAIPELEAFTGEACGKGQPDRRCREAYLALGRGYERRGAPVRAWVAFDMALALPPHARDAAVREDLQRAQQLVQDKQQEASERGPVILRYRDEVTDEYTPRSVIVSIDFNPVYTKDKGASELRSPDFIQIFAGSLSAGDHVLVVEAAHGCKPGEAARCAGSQLHRAWSFRSEAKTPTSVDVRAFAQSGDGDQPARPALEMKIQ